MLVVNERITIPESELTFSFARSGGPGGQNVNKVSSKAILRWTFASSETLPEEVKTRLRGLERRRITNEGDLLVVSQSYRDQERNKQDCLDRLAEMIRRALIVPRARKATRPTHGSKLRRIAAKRQRSQTKESRRLPGDD
ncbi:MAG: alternative ribosome rescue aminoacyl-tRNA hydrolase ArfB [Gemmataceae bacterium]